MSSDSAKDLPQVLVFGGTCETHELAARLLALSCRVTMSVASDYGRSVLPPDSERFSVLSGPMLPDAIRTRLASGAYVCVIDATHPYATSVSAHVAQAAEQTQVPYLRLARDPSDLTGCTVVDDMAAAAALVAQSSGPVLLTTGVKDLDVFAQRVPDFAERLYPRILPTVSSITRATGLGYQLSHLIAMQGPFSQELNVALIHQIGATTLVTKDGGAQGGFAPKVKAAQECGCPVIVIKRPEDLPGLEMDALLAQVEQLLEG
ncbi:MAG: precorrin-6A reductase [Coriobacteriales bacterium]|nr:precorrin-6A reductase [Coriobacteriales bacterium]